MDRHYTSTQDMFRRAFRQDNVMVQDFMDDFCDAITAGDTHAISALWGIPAFVMGDGMVRFIQSREEIEDFFDGAKDLYNSKGIVETHPDIVDLEWITDRMVLANVRWPYFDQEGNEIGEESSIYIMRMDEEEDLKLHAVFMKGVKQPH